MKKLLGVTLFLALVYGALLLSHPNAGSVRGHQLLGERIGLYGILGLAAGMLIITGGIDLSVGSLVCLSATVMVLLVRDLEWPLPVALAAVLVLGAFVGLINGLLVTTLRLQPFMVTLCGLFVFRSLARWLTNDEPVGLGSIYDVGSFEPTYEPYFNFFIGNVAGVPVYLLILLAIAGVAFVFLHLSVHGRYFFALGSNERAAQFSGIPVKTYRVLAFVLCSTLTVVYSFLDHMKTGSVTPSSTGVNDELMAIAAAVLGGCTLRGGEGSIYGMLFGAAILICLERMINMAGVPDSLRGVMIGGILLAGTILDEVLRRRRAGGAKV